MCFAPQRRAIFRHRTVKKWPEPASFLAFWLTNVLRATAACHFSGSWLAKWLRSWGVLYIFTYKCASRHSGVPFLRSRSSKMSPALRSFVHFDLQMCFAPQRRAIFADRNFQNGSAPEVFCTFWRKNVLRATAACNFSFLNSTATSAPAALARLLFEHQEARIIEKTQLFATLLTFRACWTACEWLYTHVDLLASDLTDVDLLASDMTAVRLCFSTLHIVGS